MHLLRAICIVFLFKALPASAQLDSILALPEEMQVLALNHAYWTRSVTDTNKVLASFEVLEKELKKRGEDLLAQQAWMYGVQYRAVVLHYYDALSIPIYTEAYNEAMKRGWVSLAGECLIDRGGLWIDRGDFVQGLENKLRGYELVKKAGFEKYPHARRHAHGIAEDFFKFRDYQASIAFLREALLVPPPWSDPQHLRHTYNTMGLAFQRIGNYDSAMHYLRLSLDASLAAKDTAWAALVRGNLGYTHYLRKDFDEAMPLMQYDFATSSRLGETGSAVNAAVAIAELYLLKGMPDSAQAYIAYADRYVDRTNIRVLADFYKSRYAISKLKGDMNAAVVAVDSFHFFRDSVLKIHNEDVLNQVKLQMEIHKHTHQMEMLEARRAREVLMRNGLLVFLLITGLLGWLWFNRRNLRQKKEKEIALLHKRITEDELRTAQSELDIFTKALKEKNELIGKFQAEMETLQQQGMQFDQERITSLEALINSTLLTDDEWQSFRRLFEKVYPGFFIRMKEKIPDLSPAETRLMALTKLKLSPKEMAGMLGVSYNAIKKLRQRLRKKVDLPEEGGLDELVEMI